MKKQNLFYLLISFFLMLFSKNIVAQYKAGSGDGFFVATGYNYTTLPVELIKFEAELNEEFVLLVWQTASEINNEKFILEKSFDANNWFQIAEINGAGNSYSIVNYYFLDKEVKQGTQYYRLTQVDFDAKKETFKVIEITKTSQSNVNISIFPNPVNNEAIISFFNERAARGILRIYSDVGIEISNYSVATTAGENAISIDTSSLAKGIYIFKIEIERTKTSILKVVK